MPLKPWTCPVRGSGLFDAVIALALLAFGLLGITRFQAKLISESTEAQLRLTAVQLADELLNTMLVDAGNAHCYTVPQRGDCYSAAAQARAEAWRERVHGALPGRPTATSAIDTVAERMTVQLTWALKASDERRFHEVSSDVRGN